MVTITFGTLGTAGAAAIAAAGIGAVGLAGLGVAALAGRRGRGKGRGYGGYRGRRSLDKNDKEYKKESKKGGFPDKKVPQTKEELLKEEEEMLAAIRQADEGLCTFRMVCELAAMDPQEMGPEEMEILRFVQEGDRGVAPGEGVLPTNTDLIDYQFATSLGYGGHSCAQIFSSCEATAAELIGALKILL